MDVALEEFRRHLKFRRFYDLDHIDELIEDKTLKQYFPLGLVGKTGKGNHLLVVECAGRIDLQGILKSIQMNVFLAQRMRFQEKMLREINKMEAINKTQCSVIYILDLEGLKLDPKLISVVTGPYKILWSLVYTNYPEWIDTMFIVNAPKFIWVLWKAIGPLLPERTRNKVRILSKSNYIKDLEKSIVYFRDRLIIPTNEIPKTLYWQPSESSPKHTDLDSVVLGAGQTKIITYKVYPYEGRILFTLNRYRNSKWHYKQNLIKHQRNILNFRYAERNYSMAVYYSKDEDSINWDTNEMDDWSPEFVYPWMPTVDFAQFKGPGYGIYKLQFGNPQVNKLSLVTVIKALWL
ncbi:unnamed protein product [Enterobius vermicularis]|uniref:CRAL-TRIO domain-containing protein n=1 Tax=Enterobius vermicularis TaxID=51028 RepID=A0A0N4V6T3_ENTVE|nr:unnamed protein product [Enterobius vermicularis]